jgi:hypothetical protein
MSEKQKAKHEADALLKAAEPKTTPVVISDGTEELFFKPQDTQWIFRKQRATGYGDAKNYPGGLEKYIKKEEPEEATPILEETTDEPTPVAG